MLTIFVNTWEENKDKYTKNGRERYKHEANKFLLAVKPDISLLSTKSMPS